jgi:hypothetical protein
MDTTALEVKRVQHSEDLLHPGEYVFVPKRDPILTLEQRAVQPPQGKFKLLWWTFFGQKYEMKKIVELLWREQDAIILNRPVCNSPCATTKNHKIISIEPLTLEIPLTWPYCKTRS